MNLSYKINNPPAAVKPPRPSRLIRLPEVLERVGLSRSTIYTRIKEGTFPSPVKIGEKSMAFLEADVDAWILDRLAEAGKEVTK